jgi:hypothetical protein
MRKNLIFLMMLIVSYSFNLQAAGSTYDTPTMKMVVEVLEVDKLNIYLDGSLNGYIKHRNKKLIVTPETKARKNSKQVPLQGALKLRNKYVEVAYDVKAKKVLGISWD